MINRKLNKNGIRIFSQHIQNLRDGGKQNTPDYLLLDDDTSEKLSIEIPLEKFNFPTRYDLGVHIIDSFSFFNIQPFIGDTGFWSGLALYWFDQLCPEKSDGSRKPSMEYNYILSENYNHRPRHAIYTTWQLVRQYGEHSRFLLSKELPVRGELIEQLMARQYFLSCNGVIETASKLYYDEKNQTFKRGASGRKSPGCVYRYVNWLQQLEVNYDLFSMKDDDFFKLMPSEFDRFKQ